MLAMVVDDDETIRLLCRRQLKKLGFTVSFAETGLQAVEAFKNEHFNLILMDVQMPEMDGFEATRSIRYIEKETGNEKHSIIIAMTASQEKERALLAGMNDCLFKPFLAESLKQLVDKWVLTDPQ